MFWNDHVYLDLICATLYFQTVYDVLLDLSILLIIVGGVIFLVGFAGSVGALRENLFFIRVVSNR